MCSEDAARWFYYGDALERSVIIHNVIDPKDFKLDEEKRIRIRKQQSWENKFVIGNVGRQHLQKNQLFALQVYHDVIKTNSETVLVFVGQGENEPILKQKVRR